MADFLKSVEHKMTWEKLLRGEGTGPVSKILSVAGLLVLVYLLVQLLKDQQYVPLGILLIFGFTRFGHWILLGLLVYFLFSKYWIGVVLLFLNYIIAWTSGWFGRRNITKNLYSARANVDPFEGMHDMLYVLIFQLAFFGLALLTSGILSIIFWLLFGLVTLFEAGRYYNRLSSPWRKIHFSLMIRYCAIVGYQTGLAERTGKEFGIYETLNDLIKSAYSYIGDDEVRLLIGSAENKLVNFDDREALKEFFKKKNPSISYDNLEQLIAKIETTIKSSKERGWLIRYVIAEIVGRDYGEHERLKYVCALLTGKAN